MILLAGRFRGKRVVYLKHLEDNTLLISGPFKVNGVPLRRVNARYEYFAKEKLTKKEKKEANLFPEQQNKEIKAERVEDQKVVDKALIAEIKKTPLLKQYLSASFSLKNGDKPHMLKF
mgnify:CR=1 FL=1